jgi:NADH-quinone oxidoreductase subunit A
LAAAGKACQENRFRMLKPYSPLLFIFALSILNAVGMLATSAFFSWFTKTRRKTPVKLAPYESGMPVLGDARERFSVKFYLVAVLFIVFDVDIVMLFPWGAAWRQMPELRLVLFAEVVTFVLILVVGYLYVWKRGALQWD